MLAPEPATLSILSFYTMKISTVIVLGGGSAGLIAALTLKRKLPRLTVRVIRSPDIGVIGVGEGTTVTFPQHMFEYLKLKPQSFYAEAEPTWKMGVHFMWGQRKNFRYTLSFECEKRLPQLSRNNGFYYNEEFPWLGIASAFMAHGKVFPRQPNGMPMFHNNHAFHIENKKLVEWLENRCREEGVAFTDATVQVEKGGDGIAALIADSGERITGDLYVDASGFRSELLGRALAEPYTSYADSLFCDRAVIGGWPRTDEPIQPFTTAETMDAGWCWQIEHEHFVNRGYVYSSAFISDEAAQAEFLRKNPKVATTPRVVKFRSGRYARNWVGNVVAIGNASGFVEPLEATALMVVCNDAKILAESLLDSLCQPSPSMLRLYNQFTGDEWDDIRNFLALHYKFNALVDTPFWRACQADTALHGGQHVVDYYRENGPSILAGPFLVHSGNPFRMDGYLTVLVGMGVPHEKPYSPPPPEEKYWRQYCSQLALEARNGMDVREALAAIRSPGAPWT
jgi:tryptophan 7-halogenase